MKSLTIREFIILKFKSKPNFWYTPTIEEQSKLIAKLSTCHGKRSNRLLEIFAHNNREIIRSKAVKILNDE